MRYAVSTPPALSAFCLAELEKAIVEGAPDHPAGVIRPADTEALREAVFATDEGSSRHVTRDEAEALFRIAHATSGHGNDPEFDGFFAKAVGNYLMGIAFHGTPSVADELQLEKFEDEKPEGIRRLPPLHVQQSRHSQPRGSGKRRRALRRPHRGRIAGRRARKGLRRADRRGETAWLVAHLTRDGALTPPERALAAFLKQEVAKPPAALRELFTKAEL